MREMQMFTTGLQSLVDIVENSTEKSRIDLGSALLVHSYDSVIGDFIAISSTEGKCAIVKLQ